jgi:hypothetical protein
MTKKKKKLLYFEKIFIKYSIISILSFVSNFTASLEAMDGGLHGGDELAGGRASLLVLLLASLHPVPLILYIPNPTILLYAVPHFIFKGTLSRNLCEDLC